MQTDGNPGLLLSDFLQRPMSMTPRIASISDASSIAALSIEVWLATNAENTPAIAFYLAQGFTPVGHTHFRLEDQEYLNNVCSLRMT